MVNITAPELLALLPKKLLPIVLNVEKMANMTPPAIAALLLVKVLLVILNEEGNMYMTPPLATLWSVKVLLKILKLMKKSI